MEIIEIENPDGSISENILIDRGNGEYTSMPKSVYDQQQAALTEKPIAKK